MFPKPDELTGLRARLFLGCLLLIPISVAAQATPPSVYVETEPKRPDTQMSTLGMVGAGIGCGAAGFMAGALIGASTSDNPQNEFDGLEEALVLGSLTGGITLPMGVHLANGNRGDTGKVVLTSLAIGAAGWWAAFAAESPGFLLVIPVMQLVGCVMVEESTARHNMEREAPPESRPGPEIQVGLTPTRQGLGLVVGGRF